MPKRKTLLKILKFLKFLLRDFQRKTFESFLKYCIDILKYFLTTTKGKPEYDKYFEELMGVYDQLIKYTPDLQANIRGVRSAEKTLALKAIDYLQFAPKTDPNVAYEWLSKSVNVEKSESLAAVLFYFLLF